MRRGLIGLSIATAAVWVSPAHAYNNREHERLPDQAVQIANIMRRGALLTKKVSDLTGVSVAPLDAQPATVPAAEAAKWTAFVNETKAMPDRIAQVRVGLSDPRVDTSSCGKLYPQLAAGQHLAQCKAGDIPFAVKRGWGSNTSDCFIRGNYFAGDPDQAEFFNSIPSNNSGAVLGYYGQAVDDEVSDSIWWLSVQNQEFRSTVQAVLDDASDFSLAIVLAPFACLWSLFSGDNCFDKARDWGHQANPVTRADEYAKDLEKAINTGRLDGDDLFSTTGVWHFINVEDGPNGDFNRIAGMHYTSGGWRGGVNILGVGRLDALDWGVIVGGDFLGLTLDPDQATGVSRYQQSPDGPISRRKDDWFNTIGHTEFEPLDNLALYGWRRFQSNHDASGLGWVLHALGDAVEPQHGIAATGWGHRPFEDFAGFAWPEMFMEPKADHYFLMTDIVAQAYQWWSMIDAAQRSGNPNDIPVRDLITALAYQTRGVSDYAIKTGISVSYGSGPDENAARAAYGGTANQTLGLLESGTAATLAFLVKASQLIAVDNSPSPCSCPNGQGRIAGTCQACSTINQVEVNGVCADKCPVDLPLLDPSGHCAVTCPNNNCTGVACPTDEYVENGQCTNSCSSAHPFVLGRECVSGCPANYVTVTHDPSLSSTSGPFYCEKSFCTTTKASNDSTQICCPSNKPFVDSDTCLASCPLAKDFFVRDPNNHPSLCIATCAGTGNEYFVPNEGTLECLSQCPAGQPFGVTTTGGKACSSSCPQQTPFHAPEANGATVDCLAACAVVHDSANECLGVCPPETPFHQADGLCVAVCPVDSRFHMKNDTLCLAQCPPSTPYHDVDGTCEVVCAFGVDASNNCLSQGPD